MRNARVVDLCATSEQPIPDPVAPPIPPELPVSPIPPDIPAGPFPDPAPEPLI
jgi:hypothetical protein